MIDENPAERTLVLPTSLMLAIYQPLSVVSFVTHYFKGVTI